jgi:hypothetical protein
MPAPKKSKGGRPKKAASERLEVQIAFRVTKAQAAEAEKEAKRKGLGGKNELARELLERALRSRHGL